MANSLTFEDLLHAVLGSINSQPPPDEDPFAPKFAAPQKAPVPGPITPQQQRQGLSAQLSAGNADLASIFMGGQSGRSAAVAQQNLGYERDLEEQRLRAQQFNTQQENLYGRAAMTNQALMERLKMQELGKTYRTQISSQGKGKVRILQEADPQGRPINVAYQEETDPATGQVTLRKIQETDRPVHYQSVATEGGGITRVPTTGFEASGQTVTDSSGQPLMKQPSDKLTSQVAGDITTLNGINEIWNAYQKVHTNTGGDQPLFSKTTVERVIGTEAGETKYGGKLAPQYNIYISTRRASLNKYIKSITGAQFSVEELKRYEAQFPQVSDDEETARQKLEILAIQAANDMNTYISAHGGLQRMRQDPTESWRFGAGVPPRTEPTYPKPDGQVRPPARGQGSQKRKSLDELYGEANR